MNVRKGWLLLIAVLAAYSAGYAIARARGFIVMYERHQKEDRKIIRALGPGQDTRATEWARQRNQFSPVVFQIFAPAIELENRVRGGVQKR
jgi:hypothetical protein